MSGLLVLPGFPATEAGGYEMLGKGVDSTTGLALQPNGITNTPAAIIAEVSAAWAAGSPTLLISQYWRQPNAF